MEGLGGMKKGGVKEMCVFVGAELASPAPEFLMCTFSVSPYVKCTA